MTIKELINNNYIFKYDSRDISENDVFVAYKGEKVDGHEFVRQALDAGASYCVVEKNIPNIDKDKIIIIDNIIDNFLKISADIINSNSKLNIGITGSTGKTTTKEILFQMLNPYMKTFKTSKNMNTEIGIPLSVFNNYSFEETSILEMGLRKKGDIKYLVDFFNLDVAFITNVGESHIEFLGSLDNIIKEKCNIFSNMKKGLVVCNGDNQDVLKRIPNYLNLITFGKNNNNNNGRLINYDYLENKTQVLFEIFNKKVLLSLNNFWSLGQLLDLLACLIFAIYIEIPLDPFLLEKIQLPQNRFQIINKDNLIIINDSYNASYDSFISAFESIKKMPYKNKVLIIGEVLELGNISFETHKRIIEKASEVFSNIYFFDPLKKFKEIDNINFFDNFNEIRNIFKKEEGLILIKSSQGVGFQKYLEESDLL